MESHAKKSPTPAPRPLPVLDEEREKTKREEEKERGVAKHGGDLRAARRECNVWRGRDTHSPLH